MLRNGNRFVRPAAALIAVAILVLSAGCPPPPPPPQPPVAPGTVTLYVVNSSPTEEVAYLFVSPQSSDVWGENVLGDELAIAPGEQFAVQVPPGVYDLMAQDFDHEEMGRSMGVSLTEDTQWVL